MWLRVIDSSNRFYFLYIINVLRFAERNMCTFFVFFLGLLHKLVVGPCSPCMFLSSLSLSRGELAVQSIPAGENLTAVHKFCNTGKHPIVCIGELLS